DTVHQGAAGRRARRPHGGRSRPAGGHSLQRRPPDVVPGQPDLPALDRRQAVQRLRGPRKPDRPREDSRAVPRPIALWRARQGPAWPRPAGAPAARERRPDARQLAAGPEGPWHGAGGPVAGGGGAAAVGAEAGGGGAAEGRGWGTSKRWVR